METSNRYLPLDVFRGLTIALMILVNTPGSWAYVYSPLRHAEWHGCTLTDLVFPFFLFAAGVSLFFSLEGQPGPKALLRIGRSQLLQFRDDVDDRDRDRRWRHRRARRGRRCAGRLRGRRLRDGRGLRFLAESKLVENLAEQAHGNSLLCCGPGRGARAEYTSHAPARQPEMSPMLMGRMFLMAGLVDAVPMIGVGIGLYLLFVRAAG